jgi:citrate lyase subunit beta/citryl-CoA lyase
MKEAAREKVAAAVASGEFGNRELTIRVNSLETQWSADDLRSAAQAGPSGIVVPKINSAADVAEVERIIEAAGVPDHTRIWAMLETPAAIENALEIATSSERLEVLIMGTNDLAKELRATQVRGRAPLLPHLATALLGAREAGKVILDGVFNDVKDLDAFRDECVQGAQMGFDGKTLIHPSQVEIANDVWAPSADEVDYAQRVIAAFEEATAEGRGVITVDGRMIENLHVDNARRVLAVQAAIAALG